MTLDEMRGFFAAEFPQSTVAIEAVGAGTARVRQTVGDGHLRPGGTVSGPVLMATADSAMYAALLGAIGPVALAVTTSLHIDFLRKPPAGHEIFADARLLKLGKRLAVGEVTLYSAGESDPIARASVTYSIPPRH